MANTQIAISKNGKTTLATAGKYCERNIDINVSVANMGDNIPAYVKSEADSLITKVVSAQGNRVFTIAAITDLHYGNSYYTNGILHASQALAYINKQITLDAFAVLGDYTDGYPADSVDNAFGDCRKINSLLSPMEAIPNLRIQGNHDFYSGYSQFVHYHIQAYSEDVTWGDKNGGYFYRDFSDKKLRIICVNTTETNNANLTVSDTQYNWFIGALDLSAKSDASDWQILILSHHPLDWYSSSYVFCYILEAYKAGSSWSSGNISCNFSGKNAATLIGNIHGHIHNLLTDYINKGNVVNPNPTNVLRICTPEACINRANQYDGAWKDTATYNKTTNSANDTSFVIYCIDLNAQNIKAFCYGAGYDREISYTPVLPTVYSIVSNLTNCTASGANTIVEEGTATITISANNGYKLPDTISVSGASYTYDKFSGTVTLSNPVSDVTVTIVATEIELPYTNMIPNSINADGTQYVGTNGEDGYKTGYRLNSSGVETAATNIGVTGFIPVKKGDTIYVKDMKIVTKSEETGIDYCYIALYNTSFTSTASIKASSYVSGTSHSYIINSFTTDSSGYVTSFIIQDKYNEKLPGGSGYMRISAYQLDDNAIITINEPIESTVYNITNNLTNCVINGASTIVKDGTAAITIVANDGYQLPDTINVSGASYTYDKSTGTVILSNPTSDVTITVVATEVPVNYTNQIPLSINSDGTAYIGTNGEKGYKTGYRLNSSGVETALTDWEVTGFIPFNRTDVFYFKNIQWCGGDSPNNDYIGLYDANFTKITSTKIISEWLVSRDAAFYGITLDADNNIISIDCNKWCIGGYGSLVNAQWDSVKYIRFSLYDVTNDSVITVNEPIGDMPDAPDAPIEPSYINQVMNSVENDGITPYNGGLRYKTNTRYNSSCAEAEFDSIISGYIPYNSNVKVIRIKGFIQAPTNNDYFYTFDENFQRYGKGTSTINYFMNRYSQWLSSWPTAAKFEMGEDGVGIVTLDIEELDKVSNTYPPILRESKWIRFNVTYAKPENFIITFDEEIK